MRGLFSVDTEASIGIGALIIFIAMILVAGVTASVMIQVMGGLQQQALKTGQETIRDVSSGLRVTHVSGHQAGSQITQLAIFVSATAGSSDIDLSEAYISLSETTEQVVLVYTSTCFASSVSSGLFQTINSSNLSATTFGIVVVRDIDNSCQSATPTINSDDLVVLIVNTTKCFLGIATRTDVSGSVIPESGMNGVISFNTPSAFTKTIIDLQ